MRGEEEAYLARPPLSHSHNRTAACRASLSRFVRTRCSPANSLLCRFLLYLVLAAVLIFAVRSLCWVISLEVQNPCRMGRIGPWSVGMMKGHTPLSMHVTAPSPALHTHIQDIPTAEPGPCMTCVNVIDIVADFVADPFIIKLQKNEKKVPRSEDDYPYMPAPGEPLDARLVPTKGGRPAGFPEHYPWSNTTFARLSLPLSSDHATFSRVPMKGRWFLFFEILNHNTDDGDIGVAWTEDDPREGKWTYQQVVLHEPFHLSYPFVFFHDGYYWMIPEAHQSNQIRLYRATFFPTQWKFVKPLLTSTDVDTSGDVAPGTPNPGHFRFIDTSPVLYQGRWYLFTFVKPGALYLYYSDNEDLVNTRWHKHPKFPIYVGDEGHNRPAGRPVLYKDPSYNDGKEVILRPVQNNVWTYGHYMRVMQVNRLSPTEFEEVEVSEIWPIKQLYWMSQRTHHLDLHYLSDEDLDDIDAQNAHNSAYRDPAGAERKVHQLADRRSRWFASIDGRYSFASQDLEYYLYTSFVVVIALLLFLAVVLPDLKLAIRFVCSFVRYSNLAASSSSSRATKSSSSSPSSSSSSSSPLRSWCCRVVARHAGRRRTVVCLLGAAVVVLAAIYAFPLAHSALADPSPHLPLSYFAPPTPHVIAPRLSQNSPSSPSASPDASTSATTTMTRFASSPSDTACPVAVVTALYDIGRGNKAHGQEKEQSWNNYLKYFHHVLHVNSCQVIYVEESTLDFVLKTRECEVVRKESVYVDAQAHAHTSHPGGSSVVEYSHWVVRGCRYPTAIFTAPLPSLRAYQHYDLMQDILDRDYTQLVRRPRRPEKTMVDYNLLMFYKVEWLKMSAALNPFDSHYLFWMDGGYGKGWYFNGPHFVDRRWPDAGLVERYVNPYQFFMIKVSPRSLQRDSAEFCLSPHVMAMEHRVAIAGGFLGGSVKAIHDFYGEYHHVLNDTLQEGLMDDDQYVFVMSWCRRPDLIKLHKCYHSFLPFELWTHNSQALSFGAYHCPVGMFVDTSGASLLDHEHISRFV